MPPSPPLSTRITKVMYLMLMMMISDQRMSESSRRRWWVDRQLVSVTGERLAEGVQRAGPDVAVHDSQRHERQAADPGRGVVAVSPRPVGPV